MVLLLLVPVLADGGDQLGVVDLSVRGERAQLRVVVLRDGRFVRHGARNRAHLAEQGSPRAQDPATCQKGRRTVGRDLN